MHNLLLEEAIKDFYFYEPQENIDALEDYCTCIEHGNECASLEEHIFERLEIYLEQVYPIFEDVINLETRKAEKEKKKRAAEFDRKTKGPILGRLRGALGVSSLRQGIKDAVHSVKNKLKKKAKDHVKKAKEEFKKTDSGEKIRKAIGAGIVKAKNRIKKEREKLKALKNDWDNIKDSSSERYKQAERRYNRSRDRLKRLESSKGLRYRRGVYKSVFIGKKH